MATAAVRSLFVNSLFVAASIMWQLVFYLSSVVWLHYAFGPQCEKPCLRGFANNTGADQPAHPRSLISVFINRFLESTIFNLAAGKISIF